MYSVGPATLAKVASTRRDAGCLGNSGVYCYKCAITTNPTRRHEPMYSYHYAAARQIGMYVRPATRVYLASSGTPVRGLWTDSVRLTQ